MEALSNVTFKNEVVHIGHEINRRSVLSQEDPFNIYTYIDMIMKDAATDDIVVTFRINATLVKSDSKHKLQCLKLISHERNTYSISLDFVKPFDNVYSLCGRNTSENRAEARKLLLAGLSAADYKSTVEKARKDTLFKFSSHITAALFDPSVKIKENVPLINTWLVKLLG